MKKLITKQSTLLILALFLTAVSSFAQDLKETNNKTEISVEIDPVVFGFNGYGVHLRVQPENCDHLLVGIGAYAMDLPEILVDFNTKNKDRGWDIRLNQGFSLFGEHHFTEVNRKWFVGGQIGLQEFKIKNNNTAGNQKFTNLLAMGYFGYTIKPFNNNFYIKPWAGIGYTSKISGQNTLSDLTYDIAPITMFFTLHLGYTF